MVKHTSGGKGKNAWDGVTDVAVPNEMVGVRLKSFTRKTYGFFGRTAIASMWLNVALLLLLIIILSQVISSASEKTADATAGASTPAQIEAENLSRLAIEDWLAADPSPLPGGRILGFDGSTPAPPGINEEDLDPDADPLADISTQSWTLEARGLLYTAQVATVADPVTGVQVISTPSIMPVVPSTTSYSGSPWAGGRSVAISDDMRLAVKQWAQAYVSSDPATLRSVIGDGDATHSYLPLLGPTLVDAVITDAAIPSWASDPESSSTKPSDVVARVTLTVSWDPEADAEAGSSIRYSPILYDVLITAADSAAAKVVAWGGPGEGMALEPYANAVVGTELVLATPSPTPTPSPTAETAE